MALILGFLEAGYSDRLLLSSDTRKDYSRVARFVKQLQAAGVSDAMLHTIQVDNPRGFLAFAEVVGAVIDARVRRCSQGSEDGQKRRIHDPEA